MIILPLPVTMIIKILPLSCSTRSLQSVIEFVDCRIHRLRVVSKQCDEKRKYSVEISLCCVFLIALSCFQKVIRFLLSTTNPFSVPCVSNNLNMVRKQICMQIHRRDTQLTVYRTLLMRSHGEFVFK